MAKIGFIGLGHMGNPMVCNLMKAGHRVTVYDVMPEAVESLAAQGATPAHTLSELMNEVEIVITMLQTGEQVLNSCLGKPGIFELASPHLLYIDSSSIEIMTTQQLHQEAKRRKIAMLDAPVSGGVSGAQAATLTFMVGGDPAVFEKAQPLFKTMGKKIIHAGPEGHGQAAKICNNLILGISMIAVCEGFNLAEKLGLDLKKFFEISSNASGQCWSMTQYCPAPGILEHVPSSQHYQPGFMTKMMLKDLRLAQHAAEEMKALLPLGDKATELYSTYVSQGNAELDFSGIMNLIKGD